MRKASLICLAVILCTTTAVLAGALYQLTCPNEKCGFKGNINMGGGMLFENVNGYCVKCQKCVSLNWTRENLPPEIKIDKKTPPPTPLGQVFIPATGQTESVYSCPTCKGPFLPIRNIADLKTCPKCGKPGLKCESNLQVD